MNDFWTVRPLLPGDEEAACALVRRVFNAFVAPDYEPEGVAEFLRFADPQQMRARASQGSDILLAWVGASLVGVLELRSGDHISLLFVDTIFQGRGIARALVEAAIALGRQRIPGLAVVSVNASPNSVMVYEHLGFAPTGPKQTRDGIAFIPMEKELP